MLSFSWHEKESIYPIACLSTFLHFRMRQKVTGVVFDLKLEEESDFLHAVANLQSYKRDKKFNLRQKVTGLVFYLQLEEESDFYMLLQSYKLDKKFNLKFEENRSLFSSMTAKIDFKMLMK